MNCPHGDPFCPCQDGDSCRYEATATTKALQCPHCAQPIDPRLIRKAANTLAASAPRPGSTGNTRNPYGRKGRPKEGSAK